MSLILIGFTSCGKSYFGKRLSLELQCSFWDSDALLEELFFTKTGKKQSTREIYKELQEESFRLLEQEALLTLSLPQKGVIALGGGGLSAQKSIDHLKKLGRLVYLKANFSFLKKRISPHFAVEEPLFELFLKRAPLYEKLAEKTIQVDHLPERQVLDLLISFYSPYGV